MDKERIELIGKGCFIASCKGYLGYFDMVEEKIRMTLKAPDGHFVAGEFRPTREEAVESCALEFLKNDT